MPRLRTLSQGLLKKLMLAALAAAPAPELGGPLDGLDQRQQINCCSAFRGRAAFHVLLAQGLHRSGSSLREAFDAHATTQNILIPVPLEAAEGAPAPEDRFEVLPGNGDWTQFF